MKGTDADLVVTYLEVTSHQADVYVGLRQHCLFGNSDLNVFRKSLDGATARQVAVFRGRHTLSACCECVNVYSMYPLQCSKPRANLQCGYKLSNQAFFL